MNNIENVTENGDIPCPRLQNEEPTWVDHLKLIKGDVTVEMRDSFELFETIMYITKYAENKYIIVFNDFDKLIQFIIAYVNVMEIADLYIYGFNYLRFAFPYIKYTSTLEINRNKSIIVTMLNKIEMLDKVSHTLAIYTYDENVSDKICWSNITLTTSKFIPNTIKTFEETFKIRPHKISIAFATDHVSTILDYMIKYDHRKVVLFYMDDNITFPEKIINHRQMDYDSDYDEDHLRNNNDCNIIKIHHNNYHNMMYNRNKLCVITRGEDLTHLSNDKQLLMFTDYKKSNHLFNLLSNISDKLKTVDIILSANNMSKLLEEDLRHYFNMFPDNKVHYIFDTDMSLTSVDKENKITKFKERFI